MRRNSLSKKFIEKIVKSALKEDLYPSGDITSKLIKHNKFKSFKIISNQKGILGGIELARCVFKLVDSKINFKAKINDGFKLSKGNIVATINGNPKSILVSERIALNFLSHISGIASETNKYVNKIKGKSKICCTRKTIPTLREMQKYAVNIGGGINHRFNLSDEYLIKDNHIAVSNLKFLVQRAIKNKKGKKITVEVDNLNQLKSILGLKFNTVLFDNMTIRDLKKGVKIAKKYYETEASGNVSLQNVAMIAKTGVDRISVGKITHSASSIDFKLEI